MRRTGVIFTRYSTSSFIVMVYELIALMVIQLLLHFKHFRYTNLNAQYITTSVISMSSILRFLIIILRRSQWPSGLRRVSTADRLLGLRVRIPPGAWMIVLYSKDKRQSQDKQYRENTETEQKNPAGGMNGYLL